MPETETLVKQMYFALDAKELPALAQRILDGGIPVVVGAPGEAAEERLSYNLHSSGGGCR
jgi:hypothetical protein